MASVTLGLRAQVYKVLCEIVLLHGICLGKAGQPLTVIRTAEVIHLGINARRVRTQKLFRDIHRFEQALHVKPGDQPQ